MAFKKSLLACGVAIAAINALAGQAFAQQSGPSADPAPAPVDVITVTGSAQRNEQTILARRDALGVVDAISQDDTGDLADQTVAEALIRLPGINSMQTLYGEQSAQYISVRGITPDLNGVTFDGIGLYSASNDGAGTRRVDLQLIPTQVSQKTEVYKTFSADLDGGVIGGFTNIVPYSALDGKNLLSLDVTSEYRNSTHRVPGFNSIGGYSDSPWGGGVKGLYVHKFGDRFGIVASGVYNQESWTASKPNINGRTYYTATGATAAADLSNWNNKDPLPTLVRPMDYTKFRKLFGGYLGLEFEATDTLKLSASVYDYKQIEDQNLNDFYSETFSGVNYLNDHAATFKIGRVRPIFDYDRFETESRSVIAKAVQQFGDTDTLEVRGAYGLSSFYDMDLSTAYAYSPANDFVTFDMTTATPGFAFSNPADMVDTSKFKHLSASDLYNDSTFESYEARADFKHNYDSNAKGFGFAAGVDARQVDAKKDNNTTNYLAATGAAASLGSIGSVPNYQSFGFPYPIVFLDYQKFADTVKPGLAVNTTTTRNDSLSADYRYFEDILAAYVSGTYALDRTHIIGGLRFETVNYHAYSPQSVAGSYTGTFAKHDGDYQHILPSLGVTEDVWENFKLKAAFSQSLGRPAFSDIAQAEVRNDQTLTISRGNPNLKPREASNFDLAAEYYFNGGDGMISLSGFYKDIKNEIFALHTTQDINGVAYDVSSPMNASSSSVTGVELAMIDNSIGFLPGFLRDKIGVTANVTRLWGSMDYLVSGAVKHRDALLYQPNWLVNTALFYKLPGGGEARIAWNWIDETLNTTSTGSFADYVTQPRGQLNASIRFPLTDHLLLKLEGDNLLEDNKSMMHGYYSNRYTLTMDRVLFLDLVYKN